MLDHTLLPHARPAAKEYKISEVLGSGSFATVKKATCRKDGSEWAVKIIDKGKLQREDEEALKVEVAILEQVDHAHIVRLRHCFDTPKTFYMVMELMTGGELFDRIVEKSKYTEVRACWDGEGAFHHARLGGARGPRTLAEW